MFNKATKIKDFSGHNIYVGLDVHFKSWSVSIYSEEFELKTFTQVPDVERLCSFLERNYPKATFHIAYEAGFCGFWIQRAFASKGYRCSVIHPADVPTSDKERKRKQDKIDSRKIAKGLKANELSAIHVPDPVQEADRSLMRSREMVKRDLTRTKNRIKSFLKYNGIEIPADFNGGNWSNSFIAWLQTVEFSKESSSAALQIHVDEMLFLKEKTLKVYKEIIALSRSDHYVQNVKLLKTIPGIGTLSAMTLLTELGDIARFKKASHLHSYCGITPNCHSSGEKIIVGQMTRRGNAIVKTILIESAWTAVRKDPALLFYYKQQLPKMNANKAIVKVTRKLLNRIRYVLNTRKEYETGIVA